MIELYDLTARERAILIGLVQPASQQAAAGTAARAGFDKFTSAAEFGQHSSLCERFALGDCRAKLSQVSERQLLPGPVNAGLHLAAR
jgi:hypothetical protein